MTNTDIITTMTADQWARLSELGTKKAVEELHPEVHAEFRAAWTAGMTETQINEWITRLVRLPDAETSAYHLGLREAIAKGCPELAGRHPRQAEILATIPIEDRAVVAASARLQGNCCGGNPSSNLWSAAAEYRRIGAAAMARKDRLTNASLMGWPVDENGYRTDK
jgi:hypothetical protein